MPYSQCFRNKAKAAEQNYRRDYSLWHRWADGIERTGAEQSSDDVKCDEPACASSHGWLDDPRSLN